MKLFSKKAESDQSKNIHASSKKNGNGRNHKRSSKVPVDLVIFSAIALFAFALRLIYVLQIRNNPLFAHPIMDELYHDQWAQAIASGENFIEGPYFRAPLYPFFLGIIYSIFGHGYLAPRVIQGMLGGISCGLLFLIGRRVFDRKVGVVSGLAAAGYWMLIYFDGELLIPTLIVFLDLLMIWQMLRATRKPGTIAYGLVGIVLGLSAIARPNILLFLPAALVWLVIMYPKQRLRALRYAITLGFGCLMMLLPITLRNYIVGDDVVLVASQGGVNFYIGNNPLSNGWKAIVPGTPGDWWGGYYAVIHRAEQARGRSLKPSEVSQYYYNESLDFMMEQPGRFLTLMLHKLRLFWTRWEIPNNKDLYFWTEMFTPIVKWLPLKFMVVGPLGLLGLILCWRRAVQLFPLWGFIIVYMVSVVLFFCTARYRLPIIAPLILLAVHGLFWCFDSFRRGSWKDILRPLALLVPAVLWVCIGDYPSGKSTKALSFRTLAQAYSNQGRLEQAVECYTEALKIIPDFLTARYNLASDLANLGRTSEAIEQFRIAVRTAPRLELSETHTLLAAAHDSLGFHLFKSGEHDEAIEHFREAINLNPVDPQALARIHLAFSLATMKYTKEAIDTFREALRVNPNLLSAHYRLATLLLEEDKHEEAIHHFQEILRIKPDDINALCGLGQVFIEQQRYTEAINRFKEALQIKPDYAKAHYNLGLALQAQDRTEEAISHYTSALRINPDDARAHNNLGIAMAHKGKIEKAIVHFREALRINPDYAEAHYNLKEVLTVRRKTNGIPE